MFFLAVVVFYSPLQGKIEVPCFQVVGFSLMLEETEGLK